MRIAARPANAVSVRREVRRTRSIVDELLGGLRTLAEQRHTQPETWARHAGTPGEGQARQADFSAINIQHQGRLPETAKQDQSGNAGQQHEVEGPFETQPPGIGCRIHRQHARGSPSPEASWCNRGFCIGVALSSGPPARPFGCWAGTRSPGANDVGGQAVLASICLASPPELTSTLRGLAWSATGRTWVSGSSLTVAVVSSLMSVERRVRGGGIRPSRQRGHQQFSCSA